MAAAADQRIVVAAEIHERRDRRSQIRQSLLEAPCAQQRQTMNGSIEAREGVERAHAHRASALDHGYIELAGARECPAVRHTAEREARVEIQRAAQFF